MRRRPMQNRSKRTVFSWTRVWTIAAAATAVASVVFTPSGFAASGPTVNFTCSPGPVDCVGWYTHNVTVSWTYSDPTGISNTDGCNTHTFTADTTGSPSHCYVENVSGQWTKSDITIKVDVTPPAITSVVPDRLSDANGWYNHPLSVAWHGTDSTSGIATCSTATYSGPDKASASVSGGCTDNAGNFAPAPLTINYDSTAPVLSKALVDSRNGSDIVTWKSSSPADTAVVQRWQRGTKNQPVIFRGAGASFKDTKVDAGLEYMYAVQTFDQAGNASKRVLVPGLAKIVTMRRLPYVPRVADQPILRWGKVRKARYYNVQLYRGSKRVYAAWPTTNQLGLPATWRWSGHKRHLGPGRYRWYVWAGFGPRSFARYQTVGSAQFVVPG
jgi:hypothetical protein